MKINPHVKNLASKKVAKLAAGTLIGLSFFTIISHPKSPIYKNLPQKAIKKLSFLPNIRIIADQKIYHFHHWMIFSVFYIAILTIKPSLFNSKIAHGFILGSITQGLFYKDRFQVVYPL